MNKIFYTSDSGKIRIGQKIGAGGEGTVFEVQERSDLVAKIYHEAPPAEKAEKLLALSRLGTERLFRLSAWPVDVLRDEPGGNVVGFVMKKISEAEEVHSLHSPKSRLQKFPEASWAFLIYVAANIVRAVVAIHEHGFVIGDVNPKNILVTRKATVFLLDVDSFQVSADGKTYRCEGGFPEYTPPELQGRPLGEVDRDREHDYFGLAVVVFQLLFMGRHPFSGLYLGTGEMPLERAIREFRFAYGAAAESREMKQPPGTIALEAVPAPIAVLFQRSFLLTSAADRPQPHEWLAPLESLSTSLRKCGLHDGHFYYERLSQCPWCEIETRARIRLFNFPLGANQTRSHFRLDEIWKEIAAIEPPPRPPVPRGISKGYLLPSKEATEVAVKKRNDFFLSIIFSMVAGFVIGSTSGVLFLSIFLLVLAVIVAGKIAKSDSPWINSLNSFFGLKGTIPRNSLVEKIQESKRQAENEVLEVERRWKKEAAEERFVSKLSELQNRKETYENIAKIRKWKLEMLAVNARTEQLGKFLDQFEIEDAEIKGIGLNVKTTMLLNGVKTAADVDERRLQQIPSVGESRAQRVLQWRQDLERKFVFDPGNCISHQSRLKVEREIDDLRFRLEHELSSGAFYLSRIRREIEQSRQKLQPALLNAKRNLAQAEKDCEVVTRPNSLRLAMSVMFIFFLFGLMSQSRSGGPEPLGNRPYTANGPVRTVDNERSPSRTSAASNADEMYPRASPEWALKLYQQGLKSSEQGKFETAAYEFRQAVNLDSRLDGAYEQLGYVLYRLERYEESIDASNKALTLNSGFAPYYNLGLVFVAQKNWPEAKDSFHRAIQYIKLDHWEESYSHAYYSITLAMTRLGEADETIQDLELILNGNPDRSYERFELANLYLWVGKNEAANSHYQILREKNKVLAEELRKLMKKHGVG
ncbi:MAG: hypothetical protein L0226_06245 [Acidobacteria bacterium]|nr:hypothetical protein [Acidobacteriota bacterium]